MILPAIAAALEAVTAAPIRVQFGHDLPAFEVVRAAGGAVGHVDAYSESCELVVGRVTFAARRALR